MFVDIEKFEEEKRIYESKIREVEDSDMTSVAIEMKKGEITNQFRSQLRKYLTLALGVVYDLVGVKYSLYESGKDFDSHFHTLETKVLKSVDTVKQELMEIKLLGGRKNLEPEKLKKFDLALNIILTYALDHDSEDRNGEIKKEVNKENSQRILNRVEPQQENSNIDNATEENGKPIVLTVIVVVAVAVALFIIIKGM